MAKDKKRSVSEIRADLARNRAQVSDSVQDFVQEVHPKNVAKRTISDAKGMVSQEFQNVKSQVKDEDGWRTDRLIKIGAAVAGVVVLIVSIRSIAKRRSVEYRVRKALESR